MSPPKAAETLFRAGDVGIQERIPPRVQRAGLTMFILACVTPVQVGRYGPFQAEGGAGM